MNMTYRRCGFRTLAATAAMLAAFSVAANAVTPEEVLQDPKLETRARAISQNLRCVVCQNQSIDDSNAPLAHDLRVLLRERLLSGETDEQAVDYIVARYGNFVLLKPPIQWNTLFLWAGPAFFLIIGAIGFGSHLRWMATSQAIGSETPLTTTELERIDELLSKRSST
jgi:cytochrome c-type biogenesis protein CcmH